MKCKAFLSSLVSAAMVFGCLSASAADAPKTPAKKVLIAFYSYSGNTRAAAGQIQKAVGGELFEIKPQKPYPSSHGACVAQAKKEINAGVTPPLADNKDLSGYDVIFLGSPNWWGTMAPPVHTFIKDQNLSGKVIIPFFTHGGGGMQQCETDMRKYCEAAEAGRILKAATYPGSMTKNDLPELAKWAQDSLKEARKKK